MLAVVGDNADNLGQTILDTWEARRRQEVANTRVTLSEKREVVRHEV